MDATNPEVYDTKASQWHGSYWWHYARTISLDSNVSSLSQFKSNAVLSAKGVFFKMRIACDCSTVVPNNTIEWATGSTSCKIAFVDQNPVLPWFKTFAALKPLTNSIENEKEEKIEKQLGPNYHLDATTHRFRTSTDKITNATSTRHLFARPKRIQSPSGPSRCPSHDAKPRSPKHSTPIRISFLPYTWDRRWTIPNSMAHCTRVEKTNLGRFKISRRQTRVDQHERYFKTFESNLYGCGWNQEDLYGTKGCLDRFAFANGRSRGCQDEK